jgi:hypothetical protein
MYQCPDKVLYWYQLVWFFVYGAASDSQFHPSYTGKEEETNSDAAKIVKIPAAEDLIDHTSNSLKDLQRIYLYQTIILTRSWQVLHFIIFQIKKVLMQNLP